LPKLTPVRNTSLPLCRSSRAPCKGEALVLLALPAACATVAVVLALSGTTAGAGCAVDAVAASARQQHSKAFLEVATCGAPRDRGHGLALESQPGLDCWAQQHPPSLLATWGRAWIQYCRCLGCCCSASLRATVAALHCTAHTQRGLGPRSSLSLTHTQLPAC
jgi:hypothetical protein